MEASFGYTIEPKRRIKQHNAGATNRTTDRTSALRGYGGLGEGRALGGDHLVATRLLSAVKGTVSSLQEVGDVRSVLRIGGDTKRSRRGRQRLSPVREIRLADREPQLFRALHCGLQVRIDQQNGQLLAAV